MAGTAPRLPRILLVDNDPAILQLLRRWLSECSVTVEVAENGLEALTWLENNTVDVIVSDYRMAGLNGIQLLDAVKHRWPLIRRILYTGHAHSDLIMEAVQHKVLTKQMDIALVRDSIVHAARRP